jgi:histidinol-phosphate/aromatic aminotransferase/cobyric acid decarboxylase-like protein
MIERKFNPTVPHNKLRLHSSERNTPFGKLFEKYKKSLTEEDIRYYPNTEELNPLIEKFYGYSHFLMGFGSDRCIKYFFEANSKKHWFFGKRRLITTTPSFPMYGVYGNIHNLNIVNVDYNVIKFPLEDLLNTIDVNSIVVISNPSSPIGDLIKKQDIERILKLGVPTLIDEAYTEFSDQESCIDLIDNYDNLYVTRTLSKAGGSAGTRFGVIFSQKQNIEKLQQYRDMYEITGQTFKWVKLLLQNKKVIDKYVNDVKKTRTELMFQLYNKGIFLIPSQSNWFHIKESDLPKLPKKIIFRKNCSIPELGDEWVRLQITDSIEDYKWILK